jgi:hypothetical protein
VVLVSGDPTLLALVDSEVEVFDQLDQMPELDSLPLA